MRLLILLLPLLIYSESYFNGCISFEDVNETTDVKEFRPVSNTSVRMREASSPSAQDWTVYDLSFTGWDVNTTTNNYGCFSTMLPHDSNFTLEVVNPRDGTLSILNSIVESAPEGQLATEYTPIHDATKIPSRLLSVKNSTGATVPSVGRAYIVENDGYMEVSIDTDIGDTYSLHGSLTGNYKWSRYSIDENRTLHDYNNVVSNGAFVEQFVATDNPSKFRFYFNKVYGSGAGIYNLHVYKDEIAGIIVDLYDSAVFEAFSAIQNYTDDGNGTHRFTPTTVNATDNFVQMAITPEVGRRYKMTIHTDKSLTIKGLFWGRSLITIPANVTSTIYYTPTNATVYIKFWPQEIGETTISNISIVGE